MTIQKRIKTNINEFTPRSQLMEAHNAFTYAVSVGTQPNTFVTVLLREHKIWIKGLRDKSKIDMAAKVRASILHSLSDFAKNQNFSFRAVFASENVLKGGHGLHLHILLHLPENRFVELRNKLKRCLVLSTKCGPEKHKELEEQKKKIEETSVPVVIKTTDKEPDQPLSLNEARKRLIYLCKSVNPQETLTVDGTIQTLETFSRATGLKLEPGGDVRTRRRLGSSRALGQAARRKAGWTDDKTISFMDKAAPITSLAA